MPNTIRVTIWNEFRHEQQDERVKRIYPAGIHEAIAAHLRPHPGIAVRTATLDEPEHGLTQEVVDQTDVLIWWGHIAHHEVADHVVDRVHKAVLGGMGLVVLHSGHYSKIFQRLMGTTCSLKWREAGERERLWVVAPGHPIVEGIGEAIELEEEEMYGEFFDIPEPDTLVFVSWFTGGEVFRSGCCFYRGKGKIFYFRPGHETHPTYHNPQIGRVILNAVRWAAPVRGPEITWDNVPPREPLQK
ncbi:MAG: ThuA domain-containing protein [Clostridia bacterium]|nr:trehalose utilization protein ThuA [Bacillota bacterium]MBO2521361.1 trehalose utilization protein ThuA [Bacillota bacterium]